MYQSALSGEPGQALLKVLSALRAGSMDGLPALQAYGTFFSAVARSESSTWADCLLDAVITSSNAFSLAAAKGETPSAALRAAAASDLEALQQLCVAETTVAKWVRDAADTNADEADGARWLAASAALSAAGPSGAEAAAELATQLKTAESTAAATSAPVGPPLSAAQKRAWRDRIGSRARWRDGVEELASLYRMHGCGVTIDSAVLTWRDGALAAATAPAQGLVNFPASEPLGKALAAHQAAAVAPRSVLLFGDLARTSAQAWSALAGAPGCRAVVLPRGELKSLPAVCDALRARGRTPFVIVADLAPGLVQFGEAYLALSAVLGTRALPPNVMLLATARDINALRPGEVDKEDGVFTWYFDSRIPDI